MDKTSREILGPEYPSRWVRLRTLVLLRWIAVAGQIAAIVISQRLFVLDLNLGLCALAIGLSVALNVVLHFVHPENRRLSETETVALLTFDTLQLGLLLGLTGGLNNPFALLVLAPVTIAATVLPLWGAVAVSAAAILVLSAIALMYMPLVTHAGVVLALPPVFRLGQWVAVVVAILFIGLYSGRVSREIQSMSRALLATQMALARAQRMTDIGGVVAAAAHELGTPLATITLVSSEMLSDLDEGTDLHEDAALIRDQADR